MLYMHECSIVLHKWIWMLGYFILVPLQSLFLFLNRYYFTLVLHPYNYHHVSPTRHVHFNSTNIDLSSPSIQLWCIRKVSSPRRNILPDIIENWNQLNHKELYESICTCNYCYFGVAVTINICVPCTLYFTMKLNCILVFVTMHAGLQKQGIYEHIKCELLHHQQPI